MRKKKPPLVTLNRAEIRRVAVAADCDERTVRAVLDDPTAERATSARTRAFNALVAAGAVRAVVT